MSDISDRIYNLIVAQSISYGELAARTGIPKSALQRYATGTTEKIPIDRLEQIASALHTSAAYLMGWADTSEDKYASVPRNLIQITRTGTVPLIGTIACGEPITAAENVEAEIWLPECVHADFALKCKGDSMIGARIYDGDVVYIHQQPEVQNGEIAAVLIGDEATLKRVYLSPGMLVLQPANPSYEPIVYTGAQLEEVRVLGKAVGFTSVL